MDLTYIFVKDAPLQWTFSQYSNYKAVQSGSRTLVLMFGLPFVRWLFNPRDSATAVIGLVSKAACMTYMAFCTTSEMMYLVPAIGILASFAAPSIRSLLSKLVEPDETGKMFAFVAIVENLVFLLGAVVYNSAYPATRGFFKGLCFVAASCLLIVPISLLSWLHIRRKSEEEEEIEQNRRE